MEPVIHFVVLAAATILAAATAIGLNWFLLRAAFHLMQPAGALSVRRARPELVHGTRAVTRGFARG
jgi:hypothetical protein